MNAKLIKENILTNNLILVKNANKISNIVYTTRNVNNVQKISLSENPINAKIVQIACIMISQRKNVFIVQVEGYFQLSRTSVSDVQKIQN